MAEKLITPEARLSYPALFEAQADAERGAQVRLLAGIPGGHRPFGARERGARGARGALGRQGQGDAAEEAAEVAVPGRRRARCPGYGPGTTFINVSSKQQPGVVDRYAGADGKPRPITDPSELYPGCFVRASLRPFTYDTNGSKGVSFALNNLQKLRDGERIDGRLRAEDEFEAIEPAADNVDDLLR